MPLQKDYQTPATGAIASYHVAQVVTLDNAGNHTSVMVSSFLNSDMKAAGKAAMYSQQIAVDGLPPDGQNAFAFAEAQLAAAAPAGDGPQTYTNRYAFTGAEIVE
jgi:hypothetical protein